MAKIKTETVLPDYRFGSFQDWKKYIGIQSALAKQNVRLNVIKTTSIH